MEKLEKLVKSIHNLFELEEQKRKTLEKLLEAIHIKEYKQMNPSAKSVVLATYLMSNPETKTVEKYLTYECVDSKDHKRLDRLQKKYFSQYRKLTLKSYDLSKVPIDKEIATLQKQVTKSLN